MQNNSNNPFISPSASNELRPVDAKWYFDFPAKPNQMFLEGMFRRGLRIESIKEWETLDEVMKRRCQEIKEFNNSEHRDSQEEFARISLEIVQQIMSDLVTIYKDVPEHWLKGYVQQYVKKEASETYEETRLVQPAPNPSRLSTVPKEIDGEWPRPEANVIPLWQMIYFLDVIGAEHHEPIREFEMVASKCVMRGTFGGHPNQHSLEIFLDEFQQMLDKTKEQYDIRKGALQCTRDDALPSSIKNQHDFELAVMNLYHRRGQSWHLKFYFYPELPTPRKVKAPIVDVPRRIDKIEGKPIEFVKFPDHRVSSSQFSELELRKNEQMEPIHTSGLQPGLISDRVDKEKGTEGVPVHHRRSSEFIFEGAEYRADAQKMAREKVKTDGEARNKDGRNEEARKKAAARANAFKKREGEASTAKVKSESTKEIATPKPSRQAHKTSHPEQQGLILEVQNKCPVTRRPTEITSQEALQATSWDGLRAVARLKSQELKPGQLERVPETIRKKPVAGSSSATPAGFVVLEKRTPGATASTNKPLSSRPREAQVPPVEDRSISAGSTQTEMTTWSSIQRKATAAPMENTAQEESTTPTTQKVNLTPTARKDTRAGTALIGRLRGKGKHKPAPPRFGDLSQSWQRDISAESRGSGNKATSIMAPIRKVFSRTPTKDKFEENFGTRPPTSTSAIERFDDIFPEVGRVRFKSGKNVEHLHRELTSKAGTQDAEIEDDDKDTPKDAVAQFQDLLNIEELTQMTNHNQKVEINGRKATWENCCKMFQVDPTKTSLQDKVEVAGLSESLFQYQAFGVFWQMIQARNAGGGICADSPGLGKTLTFLAMLVVERQLSILWHDVYLSRDTKSGKHLPPEDQKEGDVCPFFSREPRPGWILCPCQDSGPTSKMYTNHGIRLALVPAPLVTIWRKQWALHIDHSNTLLDMRLLIASQDPDIESFQLASSATNINALKGTQQNRRPDSAQSGQERFLVLATAQSYNSWIEKFRRGGPGTKVENLTPAAPNSSRLIWTPGQYKYQIKFGIACADESHEDAHSSEGRVSTLARVPGNPAIWGYSGTPFDHSPRCLQGILTAIERQGVKRDPLSMDTRWSSDSIYRNFTRHVFEKLCNDFAEFAKMKKPSQDALGTIIKRLLPFLTTFMIRRTQDTEWFGHELVELAPNIHQDISLTNNREWTEAILALEPNTSAEIATRLRSIQKTWDKAPAHERSSARPQALGFRNTINAKYQLRILATCPSLVKYLEKKPPLTLKNDEMKQWRDSNEKRSPYYRDLREISDNSPKLMWLRKFLIDMDVTRDVQDNEQKVIILTNFNCIGLITKLMIERYIPKKQGRAALMYAGMPPAAKNSMIEAFIGDAVNDPSSRQRKHYANYQYLIGTTAQLGKGHQLTRASVVVLLEPQLDFKDEYQAFCRVRRIGQKNPVTYTYKLLDTGSKIEKEIQKNHEEQGAIHGVGIGTVTSGTPYPPPHRINITMVGPIPKMPLDDVDEPPVPKIPVSGGISTLPENYSATSLRSRGESRFKEELEEEEIRRLQSPDFDTNLRPYFGKGDAGNLERVAQMHVPKPREVGPSGENDRDNEKNVPAAEGYMGAEDIGSDLYHASDRLLDHPQYPPRSDSLHNPIAQQQQRSYDEHEAYRRARDVSRGVPVTTHVTTYDTGLSYPNRNTLIEPGTEVPLRRTSPTSNSSLRSQTKSDERRQTGSHHSSQPVSYHGSQHGSQFSLQQPYGGEHTPLHPSSHSSSHHGSHHDPYY